MPRQIGNSQHNANFHMPHPEDGRKSNTVSRSEKSQRKAHDIFSEQKPNKDQLVPLNFPKKPNIESASGSEGRQLRRSSPIDINELTSSMEKLGINSNKQVPLQQPMDLSDDINIFANSLMDIGEDEIPKCRQVQQMIDDLIGFDPLVLEENDAIMPDALSEEESPMDWKLTWKGLGDIVDVLSHIESRMQFVEVPDSEMSDALVDIEMIPEDDIIPDEEMPLAEEERPLDVSRHDQSITPVFHFPSEVDVQVSSPTVADANRPADMLVPSSAPDQSITFVSRRPQSASTPLIAYTHGSAIQQAKEYMRNGRYDAAILLLSRIYSARSPNKMEILETMAECLYATNRTATALELLQKVAHVEKKKLSVKEKIADCLTKQRQYLKANLIYTAISKKVGAAHEAVLKAKIDANNESLKAFRTWPTFNDLMNRLGIERGQPITPGELAYITAFQREVNPRAYLMWDIEMNKVKRATIPSLEADRSVTKCPIYLLDGSVIRDSRGAPIHFYKAPNLSLLSHFTKARNAMMILNSLATEKNLPPGGVNPDFFWNSQYKVCCSVVNQNSKSFFSVNNSPAVGMVAHVPDPLSNIIHTWGEDCYTPTYFKAAGVVAVTAQGDASKTLNYNQFMIRFQPLASYVYSVFQQADRLEQQLNVRSQFDNLHKDINSRLLKGKNIPILDYLFNKLTTLFPCLDLQKQKLESAISEVEAAIRGNDLGNSEVQENIIQQLHGIKGLLDDDEGESLRSKAVGARIKTLFEDLNRAVSVREGGAATRPSIYKGANIPDKPLLSVYIDETNKLASSLLRKGMNEEEVFAILFRRPAQPGETINSALREIDASLKKLYTDNSKTILHKNPRDFKNLIWTRTLSPKELLDSVKPNHYSEIGLRAHPASDEVHANHASFAGIVLETGMTIRPFADGYVIDPRLPDRSIVADVVTPKEIADIVKKAHSEGLPCFVIGS